jgi:hypothetical protein
MEPLWSPAVATGCRGHGVTMLKPGSKVCMSPIASPISHTLSVTASTLPPEVAGSSAESSPSPAFAHPVLDLVVPGFLHRRLPSGLRDDGRRCQCRLQVGLPLGLGSGDRLGVCRGGSGSFEARVQRGEKRSELQGKPSAKRTTRSHSRGGEASMVRNAMKKGLLQ